MVTPFVLTLVIFLILHILTLISSLQNKCCTKSNNWMYSTVVS